MRVDISNRSARVFSGQLQPGKTKQRLIVVCHGYKSSSEHPALSAITNGLNRKGYATFTFNFSNSNPLDIESQVEDIADIINHFIDYDEFILLATSFGALTASIATGKVSKITGLITVNGFFGRGALGPKHRRTFRLFRLSAIALPAQRKIWKYFRHGLRPQDIRVPVLAIHADTDEIVYPSETRYFYDKLSGPKQYVVLHGSDHNISKSSDVKLVVSTVDKWLAAL